MTGGFLESVAAPCGCQHHVGGDEPESVQTMQEGVWQNVAMGADAPGIQARGTLVQADKHGRHSPTGPFLHAFLKFRLPGDPKVYMVQARVNLREIEQTVRAALAEKSPGLAAQETTAAAGGKIARKIKKGLKKAVKTVAKSKLVKGVIAVAKKAWNNPLVKAAISATGIGAALQVGAAAARVAAKAIKGGVKAKQVLSKIAARAKAGHPDAIKAARLVKAGMKITGIAPPQTPALTAAAAGADEGRYLAALLGACVDCAPSRTAMPYVVGCGSDSEDLTHTELDAIDTFATSGAFEGLRWAASRLAPHSMFSPSASFGKRDALALGLAVMSQPRH